MFARKNRRFQIYPFESEHNCDADDNCIYVGTRCIQLSRNVVESNIYNILLLDFKVLKEIPLLSNPHYFLMCIDFPPESPIVKLVHINNRIDITVRDIVEEFIHFYEEIYTLEERTRLEEESVCGNCSTENFSRFEKESATPEMCSICTEEFNSFLTLDCGHCYDKACIEKWFVIKNKCPLCRQAIKPCICNGDRTIINAGSQGLGVNRLAPYYMEEISFVSMIYDKESNIFRLKYLY